MTQADGRAPRRVTGAAFGLLALTDAALAAAPPRLGRLRLLTKPLLMPALLSRSLPVPGDRRLAAAQGFSWGGDLALIGKSRTSFLAGVGLFLAAHLCYLGAFRARSSVPVLATPGRRRFLALAGASAGGMALAAAREDRVLALPVATYSGALAAMVATAAAIDPDRGRDQVLGGAALFLASDTVLGLRTFLLGEESAASRALESVVMATYTAGQWCIGEGMRR
ncbi:MULTISPECIES: lysoplasmalogenase [unclassified Nocardioides]|uniref:lysoplasmalogenase n=1 Tax=unclassified Nocardioides TaxID=2615069 RepID=UPI0000EB61CE|nr:MULTISPECIES: lysoplasmalogenase [unclassified Nocardioides]ABL82190.1 YhhN family protein [Nocardioides sp. JS614]